MKQLFSIFLALLITVQPLSRLIVVAKYAAQKEFIAKNLCEKKGIKLNTCQGRCQLKKALVKANQAEKKTNTTLKSLLEKEYRPDQFCFLFTTRWMEIFNPKNGFYSETLQPGFSGSAFHPPAARLSFS